MALRQIVFILAVARVRRFWFKAAEATLVFAYRSEVQGVKSFCRGSQTDSGKRHHPKGLNTGTRTPQCSALRKRLAANVLALGAKAGTAVFYSFFPSFRDSMQTPQLNDKAMDFIPVLGTFITPR